MRLSDSYEVHLRARRLRARAMRGAFQWLWLAFATRLRGMTSRAVARLRLAG